MTVLFIALKVSHILAAAVWILTRLRRRRVAATLQRRRRPRQDAIAIVPRRRTEARIELRRHERAIEDGDGVGLEMEIDGGPHRVDRPGAFKIEMCNLTQRVHAGIGAAGPAHRNGLT